MHFGYAVGDIIHHIQTTDALLGQQIDRLRLLLAEYGHQHIGTVDLVIT